MTYTGNVSVGGPAQTRELPGLTITKVAVGPMNNNAYLLRCTSTGELLLIDAANEPETLLGLIGDTAAGHDRDHAPARRPLAGARGRSPRPPAPRPSRTSRTPRRCRWHRPSWSATATPFTSATPGCPIIHLRGHTPGSIALLYDGGGALADEPHLFTGDSLFPGGPGNTDHDTARFNALITDLEERIFAELPDGTWVYPGHGGDTTIGAERPHVPEWRARGW